MTGLEWILWIILATFYIFCVFTVCMITFRKGHTVLGIIGIFLPLLWLIGAKRLPNRDQPTRPWSRQGTPRSKARSRRRTDRSLTMSQRLLELHPSCTMTRLPARCVVRVEARCGCDRLPGCIAPSLTSVEGMAHDGSNT